MKWLKLLNKYKWLVIGVVLCVILGILGYYKITGIVAFISAFFLKKSSTKKIDKVINKKKEIDKNYKAKKKIIKEKAKIEKQKIKDEWKNEKERIDNLTSDAVDKEFADLF
jgi:biopolymer transport protein ExbB/TolQ